MAMFAVLSAVMMVHTGMYVCQNASNLCFKYVQFITHQLYLNKDRPKKKKSTSPKSSVSPPPNNAQSLAGRALRSRVQRVTY